MNAAQLREQLSATHRFDPQAGVFTARDVRAFAYSDGAEAEAYVAQAIRESSDVAVGSTELASRIRDWPSKYHLSPARQNLLRPVAHALRGAILEIGAGCGAITRMLGESGATVLAVEGSAARAAIAASRCRGLDNVVVVCDNFANLRLTARFDVVTLIGVLEYSRMFLEGADPVQEMLARVRDRLADGGVLLLAIENQLGLKYLAGAREDHTAVPYYGVVDRYEAKGPVTFGERELRARLSRAGFAAQQALYPFPDYKLPAVVVTEAGFRDAAFNASDVIATTMRRREPHEGATVFSEALARDVFVRNGLGPDTANSFLFVAGKDEGARRAFLDGSVLALGYSGDRERAYAKEARIVSSQGGLRVVRRRIFPDAKPLQAPLPFRLEDEDYVPGEVLHRGLERIVARPGWSADDVTAWARPLTQFLSSHAKDGLLAPHLFDCTPFNLIRRRGDGELVAFDLEWSTPDGAFLALDRAIFRGLWNSLARVDDVAPPASGTPSDVCTICLTVMEKLGHKADERRALDWIRGEHALSDPVSGLAPRLPDAMPRFGVGGRDATGEAARRFKVQVYFRAADEGYSEANSSAVMSATEGGRIVARIPLPARNKRYAKLRLDPMDIPGIVRIERVAVMDARGDVAWETRRCRPPDFEALHQMQDLSEQFPAMPGGTWLALGIDPYFDLAVPDAALRSLDGGGMVAVEMADADATLMIRPAA